MICTYTLPDGRVITGLNEFKAYLAQGGLAELVPDWQTRFAQPAAETAPQSKPEAPKAEETDADGNRIYKMGERVEFVSGRDKGRHGEISRAESFRMQTAVLFSNELTESKPYWVYEVKTDNGATVSARASEMQPETARPDTVVPDIQVDGKWMQPDGLWSKYQSHVRGAMNARASAARARLPAKKREWLSTAGQADKEAATALEAFNAWANQYPDAAKAIRGEEKPAAAPVATEAKDGMPGMTLHANRKHGKTGETIHVVTLNERVPDAKFAEMKARAPQFSGYYSNYRGRGALPGFVFKEESKAREFMGETPTAAMPETTTTPAAQPGPDDMIPANELGGFAEGDEVQFEGRTGVIADLYSRGGLNFANLTTGADGVPLWRLKKVEKTEASQPEAEAKDTIQDQIERAKRRLREARNAGDVVKERAIESEIRALRKRVFEEDETASAAPQQPEPASAPIMPRQEADNERPAIASESPETLGTVAAAPDRTPEAGRDVRGGDARGSGESAAGNREPDAGGVPPARSGGSGSEAVHSSGSGTRRGGNTGGTRGSRRARKGVSESPAGVAPQAPVIPGMNFQITDEVRLGQGGEAEKFRDNLAAIQTLKAIEAESRRATPDEQRILARYVGWGGLANAFADQNGNFKPGWEQKGKDLAEMLTPAELRAARRSTRNAHYTSQTVVEAMWDAVRRLGYKGGLVLESSMGTGNFVGLMPQDVRGGSHVIGVEYDSLTSRIAGALYPQATVLHSGFQKVPLTDGEFDLNIGNPPFGSESLRFQFKPTINGYSIHNQFFLAGMDALRPGGIQAMVVSRYLMDAQDQTARMAMAKKVKLLGAVRLPDTAFKENARTEVVTDILFFQRLTAEEEKQMTGAFDAATGKPEKNAQKEAERRAAARQIPDWVNTTQIPDPLGGERMVVNTYFAQNPEMVMGRLERSGSMRTSDEVNVKLSKDQDLESLLDDAIERLPENVMEQEPDALERAAERFKSMSDALKIAVMGHEPGSMLFEDGKLLQVIERETPNGDFELGRREVSPASPWSDQLMLDASGRWYRLEVKLDEAGKPVKVMKGDKPTKRNVYVRSVFQNESDIPDSLRLGDSRFARLKELVEVRDLLKRQIVLESEDAPKPDMERNRKELAAAYQRFTKKHGLINESANASLVSAMPDGALVLALELGYRPAITAAMAKRMGESAKDASATPAAILSERVVVPYAPPGKADSAADALAIALSEFGRVDTSRIASLLGVSEDEAIQRMADGENPLIFMDPEDEAWQTRDAYLSGSVRRKLRAAQAAGLEKNVAALEKVQPEQWGADKVTAILGSTWVPGEVYADFIKHITKSPASVHFAPVTNSFSVRVDDSRAGTLEWGTEKMGPAALIERMLNSQSIAVYDPPDKDGGRKLNQGETALAQLKAKALANEFTDWVFQDSERRNKLLEIFNEKFNTRINRQFDGQHLKLPGKVPDAIISMRRHQKNAIWRGISQRFMLLDHVVGAGKTFTAVARAMERRRMGLSRKPMIVVPNHMVEQFAADAYRLYPGAKILDAGRKDFKKQRRRRLFAKIATGDWDMVIVPHSSFGYIDISAETEERFLTEELRIALQAIKEAEEQDAAEGRSGRFKSFSVKQAEQLAEKIQTRLDAIKSRQRDRLLTFEQMGVDDMTVDEAHEFKNLFYSSRLNVRGMNDKSGSQKAFDLYNKVRVLQEHPTATVTFMTGTPISNSAVEMFQMMRYLASKELKELGLEHFDAWRALFVDTSEKWEPTESGRLKKVDRLGRTWSNMRSLMDLYYSFTDAVSIDDIKKAYREDNPGKEFPVPKVKGGERQSVVIKPTPAQAEWLATLLADFDGLPDIKNPKERNAQRLRLMDKARKVPLDVRAVDPKNPSPEDGGKLDVASQRIAEIYRKWNADRGTQIVFLDRSVPKAKGDDKIIKEYDTIVAQREKALAENDEAAYRLANEKLEKFDPNEIEELRTAQTSVWNGYQEIKDRLVKAGVPAKEIRFIQEANNDQQKQAIFDAMKAGEVRVLIGSTPRMGAGTNVQDRLVALHHVDVTWKPSDIEQREGRIVRQGNKLLDKYGDSFEVEILAYATERTVDAKLWDVNSTKLKTINGIRKYDGEFTMDFQDEDAVGMAEMAALASGDPLLLERVKLGSEIEQMELLERAHKRKIFGLQDRIRNAERALIENPAKIEAAKQEAKEVASQLEPFEDRAKTRKVTVEGQEYTSLFDAMKAATDAVARQKAGNENAKYAVSIDGKRVTNQDGIDDAISTALGDESLFEAEVGGQTTFRRLIVARAMNEAARDLWQKAATEDQSKDLGTIFGYRAIMDISPSRYGVGGKTRSVSLTLESGKGETLISHGATAESPTPGGMRSLIDNVVRGLKEKTSTNTAWQEQQIREAERDLPTMREKVKEPFDKREELEEKRKRLEQIVASLAQSGTAGASAVASGGATFSRATGSRATIPPHEPVAQLQPLVDRAALSVSKSTNTKTRLRAVRFTDAVLGRTELREDDTGTVSGIGPVHARLADFAIARKLAEFFGRRLILVENLGGFQFDGVSFPSRGNGLFQYFFLDVKSPHPLMATTGHELVHTMRTEAPEAFEALRSAMIPIIRNEQQYRVHKNAMDLTTEQVVEEIMGDVMGDNMLKREFWDEIARRKPTMFEKIARFVMSFFDRIRNVGKGFGSERYVSDVEAAGRAVREAFMAYGKEKGGGLEYLAMDVLSGAPQFSRGDTSTSPLTQEEKAQCNGNNCHTITAAMLNVVPGAQAVAIYPAGQRSEIAHTAIRLPNTDTYLDANGIYRGRQAMVEESRIYTDGPAEMENIASEDVRRLVPGDKSRAIARALPIVKKLLRWSDSQVVENLGNMPMFSRPDISEAPAKAREFIADLMDSERTFNRWWHTTVGTQFHKAYMKDENGNYRNPGFKRVFDLGQDFLTDTSRYAMIPEMEAPDLLLRMEKPKDILPGFMGGKKRISDADAKAIAVPIFQGTLTDQVVYTDEELREHFDLNRQQVEYYRQFRAAVDKSLDELAKSILDKMASTVNVPPPVLRQWRSTNMDLTGYRMLLQEYMRGMVKQAKKAGNEDAVDLLRKQMRAMTTTYNRTLRLQAEGYAPLMRFGQYTVHVEDEDSGKSLFFGMYERERDAAAAARDMAAEFDGQKVTRGILSKESYRLFNGLSPETVELFADIAGMKKEPAFQEYLRLAVNNRSAMKRLMRRKGTRGYSEDVPRVLSQFIVSNARSIAGNYHTGDLQQAVMAIPNSKGDVKDEAVKLWKYLTDPQEEAGWLRGFLFFNFLGGSVASAMVNATQPVMMTAPYLSQFIEAGKLAKIMGTAAMEAAKDKPGEDVKAAYDRALKDGIIAPHEIYQLMAEAEGASSRGHHMARLMKGWGAFFSLAEAFNRRISFIAAYRVALDRKMGNPYAFAKNAVAETQGLYNKGNRPDWARGAMGATIFTFKQFSISYLEFLKRLPAKQRAVALALLFMAAGAGGEPFAEDLMDLVDTFGQWMGYGTNTKRSLRRLAAEAFGEAGGEFVMNGVSAFLPLDLSARMGLGNLLPGTGVLKTSKSDAGSRQPEALGPVGGLIDQALKVTEKAADGKILGFHGAAVETLPVALRNAFQGMEMWQRGEYRDSRDRKVIDTTEGEAGLKAIGFQPRRVAREQAKIGENLQDSNLVKATEAGIADKWAQGLADKDSDKIADARRELIKWNQTNPDMRIVITPQQLQSRVKAIQSTRAERTVKTMPKEIRGRVAEDLRQ